MAFVPEKLKSDITLWLSNVWEKRDRRVDDWPLMYSPLPTISLIVMYNLITFLGPVVMKNREPFKIRKLIIFYNICMVLFNGYLVNQFWTLAWGNDYNWNCEPLDPSLSPRSLAIANIVWLYYVCKIIDWLDTLFFIMKKKFDHLSTLHVYHHTVMPWIGWFVTRFMPGGQPTFGWFLNANIHVIMHSYYCIAALGPKYQKFLWWKKYLTLLQMVQFVATISHCLQVFWFECGMHLPKEWALPIVLQPIVFFVLFGKFYVQSYMKKNKKNYKSQ